MTAPDAQVDVELRRRVVEAMTTVLRRLVEYDGPITEDADLADELGVGSALGLELLLEVEERVGVQIDVERLRPDELRTVGQLATFIAGHSRPW
ncbi:phosphopantetheine-binding protein [Actinosynnema sp. NPDC053489]|uniref:phosphopantetheine-binding protein n=1 Tax=Actinosynnema sp. NPDC053489 TaxID=3363916 RepID=UPI0037C9F5E7